MNIENNKEIYIIEPIVNNVIHKCYEILLNFLKNKHYNIIIINNFNNLKYNPTNQILKNKNVIVFSFFLHHFKNNYQECKKIIEFSNILFINTEYLLLKQWLEYLLILKSIANIHHILDYSHKNINILKNEFPNIPMDIFAPLYDETYIINEIEQRDINNIDILFFGSLSRRRKVIHSLLKNYFKNKNLNIVFCLDQQNSFYYSKISKIVLSIAYCEGNKAIDYYRISQLINNKIFVIHENVQEEEKTDIYNILSTSLIFCDYFEICRKCEIYLNMTQDERNKICENTLNIYKQYFDMNKKMQILREQNYF